MDRDLTRTVTITSSGENRNTSCPIGGVTTPPPAHTLPRGFDDDRRAPHVQAHVGLPEKRA
jgi:hypothetical protein